jgi:hypothetical protein
MGGGTLQWETIVVGTNISNNNNNINAGHQHDNGEKGIEPTAVLNVSNPAVPLPVGSVDVVRNVVSREESAVLQGELDELSGRDSTWEGFDGPRRRVQEYCLDDNSLVSQSSSSPSSRASAAPDSLRRLRERIRSLTGLLATHATFEEYAPAPHKGRPAYDPTIMSSFPRRGNQSPCRCEETTSGRDGEVNAQKSCCCFVVEIPLLLSSEERAEFVQAWHQPESRQAVCWQLESPDHWTDVRLHPNTAIIKRNKLLTDWRSSRVLSTSRSTSNVRMLRLYRLPAENHGMKQVNLDDTFGYISTPDEELLKKQRQSERMPTLRDMLTIIITTSPIRSNPSTIVLERAMETFRLGGEEFAYNCRKVIVCDGFRTSDDTDDGGLEPKITKKHSNVKQAMRNGIVNSEQADNYRQFKDNLRSLCSNASEKSPFLNSTVVELEERHGYGFALRHALRDCLDTPFVCVVQHDRTLMRPTPIAQVVQAMWRHTNVKYVGFSMRSNLMYRDIFTVKYGAGKQQHDFDDMVLRVPELCLPAGEYGPESTSTRDIACKAEKIRSNIRGLVDTYNGSSQSSLAVPPTVDESGNTLNQMSLVPTLFWYDNIHICETEHYRDFVFHKPYKMVARGGFVEDKLSPVLKRTVERLGLKDGHSRFGCYLLDDHSGMFFTGHLDGGSFMTDEEREVLLASKKNQT